MIRYALSCERRHGFDSWFRDAKTCDDQLAAGSLACPACGSVRIEKQLMTPSLRASRETGRQKLAADGDPRARAVLETMRKLRRHVEEHADYVGERFAEEARRMHFNEVEARGIYGEATLEEARALLDEGIEAHPLPLLPDDAN